MFCLFADSLNQNLLASSGEKGIGPITGKPLHYKGSFFHRIIKGSMAEVCCLYN